MANSSKSFNVSRAQECASILCGKHDFIAFRGAFRGNERGKVQDTICTLNKITVAERDKEDLSKFYLPSCITYKVTVTGDRFLYKMVRFLVGTIIQYGLNEDRCLQDVQDALSSGNLHNDGDSTSNPRLCAPSNGLVLDYIDYGDKWKFNWIISI